MFTLKVFLAIFLIVGISARHIMIHPPKYLREDSYTIFEDDLEGQKLIDIERGRPSPRIRRQVDVSMSSNSDGSAGTNFRLPVTGNDNVQLDAIGAINSNSKGGLDAAGAGLSLNSERAGLTVMGRTIPGPADQITGSGRVNLFHNDNHKLDANAFISHTMPKNPAIPDINVMGGKLDYMYKNKIGAELGVSRNDLFHQTDYSAMGKLNIIKTPTSSFDFNAGFSKSSSPFFTSDWQPSGSFTYSKHF